MNKIKIAFAVIIFITAAYYSIAAIRLISGVSTSSSYSDNDKRWNTDIQHAIQQSRETGKFLLIDFWGVSCKNCDAMDATTLQASSVITAMENYIPLKINADIPDDTSAALLKEFGIIGLPTYVIAQPE